MTYLSYQQQGCILNNFKILLVFDIHKLHQLFNLESKICLLKSSWEMVRKLSSVCSIKSLSL